MFLAHHYPDDFDRCVLIGHTHVCRRCIVLYPLAIAVAVLTYGQDWPTAVDAVILVVLPVPAVIEFVLEQWGKVAYSPQRVIAVTVPLAVGLGRGFALYFNDVTSRLFWGVVVVYGGVCFLSAVAHHWRASRAS